MAVNLPVNPSPSQATVGKDYLLYINTGTPTTPTWTLIGGQRAGTLNRKAEVIDASNKTTGGWKQSLPGLLSWSIALDGLVLLQDLGIQALEVAFNAAQQVEVQFVYPDNTYRTGWASITELSIDNQYNQAATLKGTLDGVGPLSELCPAVSPASATVSIPGAADTVFQIAPTYSTIASVTNGATAIPATDYTYSNGAFTLKGTYIATLTAGTDTITITDGNGNTATITLTVTA